MTNRNCEIDRCVRGAREWYRGQSAPNVTKLVRCADGISPGHFERMQLLQHIDKGIYADQLERWFAHFPRCSFYITSVERFYGGGARTTARTVVPRWKRRSDTTSSPACSMTRT